MRHPRWLLLRGALSVGLITALAACADTGPTAPSAAAPSFATGRAADTPPLLVCPAGRPQQASAVIGPSGGTLALGGHLMTVPEGAVRQPTEFTMAVPASRYLELDLSAAGQEHYQFERPVSIVIDYTRCRNPLLPSGDLSVWYIDAQNQPVEDMGGVDDRLSRRVQFWTNHLSSYAIAY